MAATPYLTLVKAAALQHGVPVELIAAVITSESGWRATAYRREPRINDASHGLMQLLYKTARALGYTGEVGEASRLTGLYDPATNIDLGAKLLAANLKQAGNIAGAISAYNGGYRPSLGFGKPATRPLSICLARDQTTGECIKRRDVPVGEYSNAAYVLAILMRMQAYGSSPGGPDAA